MITISIQGADYGVVPEAMVPHPQTGEPVPGRVLRLQDPVSGIAVNATFVLENAEDVGAQLQGRAASKLVVPTAAVTDAVGRAAKAPR